ncbi:C-type lectin domain family 2 member D-like isoform X2 [Mauremys reevesii]|uniref:C-type lectin domain family 2 member D-like isoform X2 n=1 Tax=Mauremys reevesii TaxID=260615 RepID=UPI00193F9CC8|nr:C-type lectin domain family 2 member D-like isoform X2 [Mauremys reevesii]
MGSSSCPQSHNRGYNGRHHRSSSSFDRDFLFTPVWMDGLTRIQCPIFTEQVVTSRPSPPWPPAASCCPDGWIRIQGKCYYFSKAEENWTYSQNFCSSHGASLAEIESPQELGSLLPYKGRLDHWIGLRKDTGQVWKWADGTEFDHWFQIHGGADCAQLDEDFTVVTSSCSTPRKWICSKPDTPGKGEEGAVGGDS